MQWDPDQYQKFADERGRPFRDLLDRIDCVAPRRVVDLGCGPGNLTVLLAERWPAARIEGIDSSVEMVAQAATLAKVHVELGDIAAWAPRADTDVVISNAALQWVPGHLDLLRRWAGALAAGSWLAWQVPGNFASPSHALLRELAAAPRWAAQTEHALRHHDAVASAADYAALLLEAGWSADVWETTYLHVLSGADPVLEWMRGTGLRPVLELLDGPDQRAFEEQYAALLREAYPTNPHGTVLDFRRIFAVGHKPLR